MTSDHTNESATLTVKHQEDGRVCTGRLSALDIHIFENTATAEREPRRHRWGCVILGHALRSSKFPPESLRWWLRTVV